MKLQINQTTYTLAKGCSVRASGKVVVIDEVESYFSSNGYSTHQLIIVFDQPRTASWFANLITDRLCSGQEYLRIEKTAQWDANYPFGYSYN